MKPLESEKKPSPLGTPHQAAGGLHKIFGGAAAQGHYSLGYSLAAVSMMLAGSLAPLLMREYAIAYEKNDKTSIKR